MRMTREDAIKYFESLLKRFEKMRETETSYWGKVHTETTIEAIRLALSSLRPVSRERVEKVWRGYWEHDEISSEKSKTGKFLLPTCSCSKCGSYVQQEANFCPVCGDAKTDEAVEMVMERLPANKKSSAN